MKKIFFSAIVLLLFYNSNAQTTPTGENISLDQQLSLVNQSSVTSGIIYERTMQLANLYNFNKRANFCKANFTYFKQSLLEMNKASNNNKFTTVDGLKNLISTTTISNQVDLGILNTQFHILNYNEDNPSLGGLTFNQTTLKFSQIAGKMPFVLMHNTIIAPLKDYLSGSSVIFKIRNDLFFKNGTKVIKTLIADFGDGINRTLISNQILTNQNITVNYTSSGEKICTFNITYTDNSILTTYGKVYFKKTIVVNNLLTNATINPTSSCSSTNDLLKQDFHIEADFPFTGYNVGDPNIKAQIDYRVFYSDGNTQRMMKKPIIIIDGFYPGDKRKN